MSELPAGTVTFLFTDIEGSTRLLEELGSRYVQTLAEHHRLLRAAFARHGGVEVDTEGDAFFAVFTEAREAARAATEAQAELARGRVRVRMGLHTGEPIVWAEGYAGMEVHRAARISAAAHGGQVVVSERTASLLDGDQVRPLGVYRLKDLSAPQALFQLGEGEFPPLRTLRATNLPTQPSPLIGRERELEETIGLLKDHVRLLTLTGAGGSGKTRLGVQLAAEIGDEFLDGVFWVALAGVSADELVLPTIATTIGAKDGLVDHIGAKRMLLLLDNFEQVVAAGPNLGELLARCPNLKLLVTSRVPLRVAGEREYEVAPLGEDSAVDLFTERARAIVAGFEPDRSVVEICRRLDRLPLAIELAAARVRVLEPAQLLGRLERRLPLLTGGPRDAPERQRTLSATIEWSYDLLEPGEQLLFARLAVFAGSFDLGAAETVCAATLDAAERLVEQSLLRRWAGGRLGMLETIREFGLERLGDTGEREETARAHLQYFLVLAEAGVVDWHTLEWLNRVDADRDNFRAAMRWALDHDLPVLALRLASALGRFWTIRAHHEGYGWLSEALEAADDAPPNVRAAGLMAAASAVAFTGDFERATTLGEEALALFRELGDDRNVAHILDRLSGSAAALGDAAKARALADESLGLFRKLGDPHALYPLSKIAGDEWIRGDRKRGLALTEEVLALTREIGDSWWEAGALHVLAAMAWELGDLDRAGVLVRDSVSLSHQLGNLPGLVEGLALCAAVAAAEGRRAQAGRLLGAVEAIEASGQAKLLGEDRGRYEEAVLALSDAELEAARAEGRALTVDEAVEYALTVGRSS